MSRLDRSPNLTPANRIPLPAQISQLAASNCRLLAPWGTRASSCETNRTGNIKVASLAPPWTFGRPYSVPPHQYLYRRNLILLFVRPGALPDMTTEHVCENHAVGWKSWLNLFAAVPSTIRSDRWKHDKRWQCVDVSTLQRAIPTSGRSYETDSVSHASFRRSLS